MLYIKKIRQVMTSNAPATAAATPPVKSPLTFADLFTYSNVAVCKYPTNTTVNFTNPLLLRDVEVNLGPKVVATLKQGTKLEAAIWVSGSRLELKCSFGTRVPLAEKPAHYEALLKELAAR